jgi:hypothetical protein
MLRDRRIDRVAQGALPALKRFEKLADSYLSMVKLAFITR